MKPPNIFRSRPAWPVRALYMSLLAASIACGGDSPSADIRQDVQPDTALPDTSRDTSPEVVEFDTQPAETTVDTAEVDTGECRGFGCACLGNGGCDSGLCVEGPDGFICTDACLSECPSGFDCLAVPGVGPDGQSVCVPRHARLCRPCRVNTECQSVSDPYPAFCIANAQGAQGGSSGSFCATSCAGRPCPDGYTCDDVSVTSGGTAKVCRPSDGACDCRDGWSALGLSTDCSVKNAFGSCPGTRSCGASGLTVCTGAQASPELCDGVDNDCDGQTDNLPVTPCYVTNVAGSCEGRLVCGVGVPVCDGPTPLPESCNGEDDNCDGSTDEATCDDGLFCTVDSCAAPVCSNTLMAGFCSISGACFADGQFNPLNPCERCDASVSTSAWSRAPNTCQIGGACYPANAVNPQNACQLCQPDVSATQWSGASNTCQIGGQCVAANQANPNSPCQICNPLVSTSAWSQASNTCQIQGQCYAAGVTRPGFQCQLCDPQRSSTGWSMAGANIGCEDNNACSAQSFCNGAGLCVGDTSCNDGVACTEDICYPQLGCDNLGLAPGFCRISGQCVPQNTSNPTNPCERCNPAVSTTSWSAQPNNVGCSDGLYCTVNDRCDGTGRCVGEARNCSDGLICTVDACLEGAAMCSNMLANGQCAINGVCYPQGATQANNVCYACNPASSTTGWSLNNNAACNDGDSCTINDRCSGGVCIGNILRDPWENNDTISAAFNLGNFTDAQSFPQRTVSTATIAGEGDVDWYVYFVDDVWNGLSEPRVRVGSIAPTFVLETCLFLRCTEADALPTKLDCARVGASSGGLVTYGGKEHRGCCRTGSNTINIELSTNEFDCPGEAEDYRALVRVRNTNDAWTCNAPYSLEVGNDGTQLR